MLASWAKGKVELKCAFPYPDSWLSLMSLPTALATEKVLAEIEEL